MTRGIIFRPDMAQAIAEGRKTQTRRVVKLWPDDNGPFTVTGSYLQSGRGGYRPAHNPSDYLYVREAHALFDTLPSGPDRSTVAVIYRGKNPTGASRWRPSIHMPRWAARTYLQIDDVRVERIQEISEEDARAEGSPPAPIPGLPPHVGGFSVLWGSIHGGRAWERNDWVWVYRFHRVEKP